MKLITLCKACHNIHYPELKQPEGTALYMATGYCKHCGGKGSVKRYVEVLPKEGK